MVSLFISNAAGYVRAQYMTPPILQSRLAQHLQLNARPGYLSDALLDVIVRMLCFNPSNRITAVEALQHPFFADCEEARIDDGDEPVAEPDDGGERSLDEIIAMIKQQQVLLRSQRERQSSTADHGLPGM
jgi:serine/threonine protein kinase